MLKKYLIAMLAVCGLLVACSSNKDEKKEDTSKTRVDGQAIVEDDSIDNQQKAIQLVNAGEMLFTPESFFLANPIFETAIALDPENKKAQMYKAMIKPLMNMKGIVKRIEPLVKKDPIEYANYQRNHYGEDSYYQTHPLFDQFLKDGEGDISSEKELQDFFQSQIAAYNEARLFFKNNRDLQTEVNISEKWYEQRAINRGNICTYTRIHDLAVDIDCRTNLDFMKMKVDRGEMEVFKNSFAGMQVYLILMTAYNATGAQEAVMNSRDIVDMTQKELFEIALATGDQIGTLRDDQALASILDLGIDGMTGVRWVKDNQETLCPLPTEGTSFVHDYSNYEVNSYVDSNGDYQYDIEFGKKHLRREGYVFDEGLCLDELTFRKPLDKVLNMIEVALGGGTIEIEGKQKRSDYIYPVPRRLGPDGELIPIVNQIPGTYETGEIVTANLQPATILTSPIQDLRSVMPNEFNRCGEIKNFTDNTLGGLFPDGDAAEYLSETQQINKLEGECAVD